MRTTHFRATHTPAPNAWRARAWRPGQKPHSVDYDPDIIPDIRAWIEDRLGAGIVRLVEAAHFHHPGGPEDFRGRRIPQGRALWEEQPLGPRSL